MGSGAYQHTPKWLLRTGEHDDFVWDVEVHLCTYTHIHIYIYMCVSLFIYIYIRIVYLAIPVLKFLGANNNEPYPFVCVQVGRNRVFSGGVWAPPRNGSNTIPHLCFWGSLRGGKVHQPWKLLIWLVPTWCL